MRCEDTKYWLSIDLLSRSLVIKKKGWGGWAGRNQSPRNQKMCIFKRPNKQNVLLGKRVRLPKASKKTKTKTTKTYRRKKVETKDLNTWLKWD